MSKIYFENSVPAGESTDDMVLVFNRSNTPKTATVHGHILGAKERAWISWDDPVAIAEIKNETFRIVKNRYVKSDRVVVEQNQGPLQVSHQFRPSMQAPIQAVQETNIQKPATKPVNQNNQKRKSKK